VEIAKVVRRFPWMVEVIKQRPMSILHPYTVEVYVAVEGSEACISLTSSKAFCAQNGAVKEVKLELEFSRYEVYVEKIKRDIPTKETAGLSHSGEGVREDTLNAFFLPLFYI
jgi:hypothetical protein